MGFGKTIDDRQNNPESMYGGVYYRDRLYRLINTWVKHVKLFKFSFNIHITLICYISQKKKKEEFIIMRTKVFYDYVYVSKTTFIYKRRLAHLCLSVFFNIEI